MEEHSENNPGLASPIVVFHSFLACNQRRHTMALTHTGGQKSVLCIISDRYLQVTRMSTQGFVSLSLNVLTKDLARYSSGQTGNVMDQTDC